MAKYIIKSNLPTEFENEPDLLWNEKDAKVMFMCLAEDLSKKHPTKVVFRNNPLRGTIQVEIDGFYYWVELYKEG